MTEQLSSGSPGLHFNKSQKEFRSTKGADGNVASCTDMKIVPMIKQA